MEEKKRSSAAAVLAALGKSLCYLLLFLACQMAVSLVYSLAAALYVGLGQGGLDPIILIDQIMDLVFACTGQISLISDLAVLILLTAFFLLRRKNPLREVGIAPAPLSMTAAAAGLAPILYLLVTFVLALLPEAWLESYAEASAALNENGLATILATVVAAPIAEEVVFRGLILSRLKRAMPGWLAVVLSALVFGLCHGQAVWIAYAFTLGLIFGLMAHRSGSILPSMLAHFIFNGIGQLMTLLEDSPNALSLLFSLALAGVVVCILARRGLAALFRVHPIREENYNV
ncbi:MAG: lysostaphin resistance A-like protein [Candidatus Enterenecus sp.]